MPGSPLLRYTLNDLKVFSECPVKWHLMEKRGILIDETEKAVRNVATTFLYKRMRDPRKRYKDIISRINSSPEIKKRYKSVKDIVMGFKDNFDVEFLDVRCINLPFTLVFIDNIMITGNIDVIRKSVYGADIIIYDFSDEIDMVKIENDPIYMIYFMGFEKNFAEDINALYIYNFKHKKLIDISRDTDKMCRQMDELSDIVKSMRTKDIAPAVSKECDACDVSAECMQDYKDIEKEIM